MDLEKIIKKEIGFLQRIKTFRFIMEITANILNNPNTKQLMSDDNIKFDLVIAEWMFSEAYAG